MSLEAAKGDLAVRRRGATPDQVVRGVLVTQVIDFVRERRGDEAARGCAPSLHGKPAFASVAIGDFVDLLGDALDRLVPAGVEPEAFYDEIGRRSVLAIRGATIGRTFESMAAGDPLRLFQALGSGPSILVAFGERRVLEAVPGRARIAFIGSVLPPGIFAGMYGAMAEAVGGRGVKVAYTEAPTGDSEYVVTWTV